MQIRFYFYFHFYLQKLDFVKNIFLRTVLRNNHNSLSLGRCFLTCKLNKKDWARQMPHFTYVTRPRTIRPPPPSTTTPTTTTTTTKSTSTPSTPSHVDYDDEYHDNFIVNTTPKSRDRVPTMWPTSNWWGSIDPFRKNENIPTNNRNNNRPSDSSSNSDGSYQRKAYVPTGRVSSSSSRPQSFNPTSTTSTTTALPYFQLLLAGLVQVTSLLLSERRMLKTTAYSFLILSVYSVSYWCSCGCRSLFA